MHSAVKKLRIRLYGYVMVVDEHTAKFAENIKTPGHQCWYLYMISIRH